MFSKSFEIIHIMYVCIHTYIHSLLHSQFNIMCSDSADMWLEHDKCIQLFKHITEELHLYDIEILNSY